MQVHKELNQIFEATNVIFQAIYKEKKLKTKNTQLHTILSILQ